MPIQVRNVLPHTISGTELSRVRTELYQLRIFPSSSPHPVEANSQPASHGYFRNVPLPTHGQEPRSKGAVLTFAVLSHRSRIARLGLRDSYSEQGLYLFLCPPYIKNHRTQYRLDLKAIRP